MHKTRKNRLLIIGSLLSLLLMITVGYAVFQTQLEIKGSGKITSNWDIRITNVTAGTPTGNAESASTPTWTDLTAYMEANLYSKGDAMDYDVTISNRGTLDAKLDDVIGTPSNNAAVIITFSGYTKGEKLAANSDKIVHVKIAYNPDYNGGETSGTSTIDFNFTQDFPYGTTPEGNILMYNYTANKGNSTTGINTYLTEGTPVDLTPTATKQWGWTFNGWNTNQSAHTGLQSLSMPNQDTTIYALFSKTLTINYEKTENVDSISKSTETCTMYNSQVTCQVTLPTITPKTGYEANTWYYGKTAVGSGGATYNVPDGNYSSITLVTGETANAYTVTYDYAENGGTSATKTTDTVDFGDNIDLTPTATKDGYQFVGWNTDPDAHTGLSHTPNPQTMPANNITLYAIYKKPAVTLKANFNANNATLSSTDPLTCTIPEVYNKAVQSTTCTVTAPTITAPTNTPDVVGFNLHSTDTTNIDSDGIIYNPSTGVLTLNTTSDAGNGRTWYAITKKSAITHTITFNKNGATSQTNASGTASTAASVTRTCTRAATYNGTAQAATCSITSPTIVAASGFNVVGYNTSATATTSSWNHNAAKNVSANATYYAITKSEDPITITFNKNGATSQTNASGTASTAASVTRTCYRYNGAAGCSVKSPTIVRDEGTPIGYNTSASATTSSWNANTAKTVTASTTTTYYAITKRVLTLKFAKGSNASAIGATSRTCTIYNTATSCKVSAPAITANDGYFVIGWNTTSGATHKGHNEGAQLTVTTTTTGERTYYGNCAPNPYATEDQQGEIIVHFPSVCTSNVENDPYPVTCTYQVGGEAVQAIEVTALKIFNSVDSKKITMKANVGEYPPGEVTYTSVIRDTMYVSNSGGDTDTGNPDHLCDSGFGYGTINCPFKTIKPATARATLTKAATVNVMDNITAPEKTIVDRTKALTYTSCTKSGSGVSATCNYTTAADDRNTITKGSSFNDRILIVEQGTVNLQRLIFDGGSTNHTNGFLGINSGGTVNYKTAAIIRNFYTTGNSGTIYINSGGALNMSDGNITANKVIGKDHTGGGVALDDEATMTMTGGNITNNSAYNGGGVHLNTGATMTMSGGSIKNNTASNSGGGGFVQAGGAMTLSGDATIRNNTCTNSEGNQAGGVSIVQAGDVSGGSGRICSNTPFNWTTAGGNQNTAACSS